jgi:hypothetical protein
MIRNAVSVSRIKPGKQPPTVIDVASIVSSTSGDFRPVVQISWGDQQGQLSPGEARDHAERIRRTADAAESDAFLFSFMTGTLGLPAEAGQTMLYQFREYREERARKDFLP